MAIYSFYFNLLLSTWFALAVAAGVPQPCILYKCGGSRLDQPCACDDLCLMYGDCCGDHPYLQTLNVSKDQHASGQPDTKHQRNQEHPELSVQQDTQNPVSTDRRFVKQHSAIVPDGENQADHRNTTLHSAHNHREQLATVPSINTDTARPGDRGSSAREEERTDLTVPHPRIHCVDTRVEAAYLLVDQCIPDWHSAGEMNDEYVREMCETRHAGALREYLIPVTESATGLSYRNLFCGVCNEIGEMAMWGYEVHCEESWSQNASDRERFHETVYDQGKCKLTFTEPARRECSTKVQSECLDDGNGKHARRCLLYMNPIVIHIHVYKNLDCAMCSGKTINTIMCTEITKYTSSRSRPLSQLARFKTLQHSSRIQSNQIIRELEKEIKCDKDNMPGIKRQTSTDGTGVYNTRDVGMFYLTHCREVQCPQGYTMTNGLCVIDERYNYLVSLHTGSHTASLWQSEHVLPVIKQHRGTILISMHGANCWDRSLMCMEVYYQSAQNLSETTGKLLSVLYGAYKNFKLTTDVYGKGDVTSNCTRFKETKNSEVTESDISQMLDMISGSFQWPVYMNLSLTYDGMNTREESKIQVQVCQLQSHTCPIVTIRETEIDNTHAEIWRGFKKFSNIPWESNSYGMCADDVHKFLTARRDRRNKELVIFLENMNIVLENMKRRNDKNDANIGSVLETAVVCLGVFVVVVNTAM